MCARERERERELDLKIKIKWLDFIIYHRYSYKQAFIIYLRSYKMQYCNKYIVDKEYLFSFLASFSKVIWSKYNKFRVFNMQIFIHISTQRYVHIHILEKIEKIKS